MRPLLRGETMSTILLTMRLSRSLASSAVVVSRRDIGLTGLPGVPRFDGVEERTGATSTSRFPRWAGMTSVLPAIACSVMVLQEAEDKIPAMGTVLREVHAHVHL